MGVITMKGNEFKTSGQLPAVGSKAPDFEVVDSNIAKKNLSDYKGKNLILNIFPSIDTPVCDLSVRKFNKEVLGLKNTIVLCLSADLPFAHKRFCTSNKIENVTNLSVFRSPVFGIDYGVTITTGPLRGLLSRAIIIIDSKGIVKYTQLVSEVSNEPDYEKALEAIKAIS